MIYQGFLAPGLAVLCSRSNEVLTGKVRVPRAAGVPLPPSTNSLPGITLNWFPRVARMAHLPPSAQVSRLPTTIVLYHVVWMLLAARIQRGQELGL